MAAKSSTGSSQRPGHLSQCRGAKAVFGLLVLIVGLYAVAGELGALGSKTLPVSPWWLLVVLVGLFMLLKSAAGGKCPACR